MLRTIGYAAASAFLALAAASCATSPLRPAHNALIFVADGLRYGSVNQTDTPGFAAVQGEGVNFVNSHAVYPTLTTVNAASIATGHFAGDNGDFANFIYPGEPPLAHGARVIGFEDDAALAAMDARFGGDYLREQTLLAAAQARGYTVVSIGKTGPTGIQTRAVTSGGQAILIDESLGLPGGPVLPADIAALLQAAHLPATPPPRALNNRAQQDWFASVAADVLLPRLSASGRPFIMLFWSPDPDSTQHSQTDSLNALTPGINGASSRAAIAGASGDLQRLRDALSANRLEATTDVFVTADHGFASIAKQSQTSYAASLGVQNTPTGQLPFGFLAVDLAHALDLHLFQSNGDAVALDQRQSARGSALLGPDSAHPQVIVAANGGSDLIYLPGADAASGVARIVQFLSTQDYVGAIFVADRFGDIPGALPLSAVNLTGGALTPQPAIIVSFRSFDTGCGDPEMCAAEIADTPLAQGQGMHGSLSRAETRNFMAAIGPDFRAGFVDPAPVSNADLTVTIAQILGLRIPSHGQLRGRVIGEALRGGAAPAFASETLTSAPAANGFQTVLNRQNVGGVRYFDAAGARGRAVGLHD
jgi:type I phosphodiesterase/nucleotide pyrophosphatase